jgi:hypothetical protein
VQHSGIRVIEGTNMSRVIAVVACGFFLTGCSSSWMPSVELPSMPSFGGSSGSQSASLAVESDPPGAEARASTGGTCRTPCRLNVTATDALTVNIALNGYVPQSVPIHVMQPDDPRLGSSEDSASGLARLDPNPVYVELERAPSQPTAPAKRKSAPRHAPTAARHAPANAANQDPAAAQAPTTAAAPSSAAPPPAAGGTSWPMPR